MKIFTYGGIKFQLYKNASGWCKFENIIGIYNNTGVDKISDQIDSPANDDIIYDMFGRKINSFNRRPGIYIKNRQKYIMK